MRRIELILLLVGIIAAIAACANAETNGPRLVQDVTIVPTTPAPTRILSPTPVLTVTDFDSEVQSPLQVVTLESDFVLVTPTLPPSKTPTTTPTYTYTPTLSPTPTQIVTATATRPLLPTSVIRPVTAVVAQPTSRICDTAWFFIEPRPANCPSTEPSAAQGVYQAFENGYMLWLGQTDAIYVLYNDIRLPRWEVYRDQFEETMMHDDPGFGEPPSANLWRPRRGFGLLWRGNEEIRERIGWAIDEWEQPYSVQLQSAEDGSFFISTPVDGVFNLLPGGRDWTLYSGYTGF